MVTNPASWMVRIAQDWLVLELTDNVAMVGLTMALQFGPILFIGMWAGVVADRYDKRVLLMACHATGAAVNLTVGILVIGGWVQGWHVLLGALVVGMATAFDVPAREALLPELAGSTNIRNAVGLNTTIFQLGALIGPTLAGVSIAVVGKVPAFMFCAASGVAAVLLLASIRPEDLEAVPRLVRAKGQLAEAARYVRISPQILWPVVLIGFVSVTGINLGTVLAAYANGVLDSGATGYSQLTAAVAAGAVLGSIVAARRPQPGLRRLVYLVVAVALLQLAASQLGSVVPMMMMMLAFGFVANVYLVGSASLVQAVVRPHLRGRVLALYGLVCLAAQAACGLIVGAVAQAYGAQVAMVVSASGPLVGALLVGVCLARSRDLRLTLILRDRPGRGWLYVRPRVLSKVSGGLSMAQDRGGESISGSPLAEGVREEGDVDVSERGQVRSGREHLQVAGDQ